MKWHSPSMTGVLTEGNNSLAIWLLRARRTQQEARAGRLRLMARDPQIKARALATEQAIESGSPPPDRAAVDSLRSGDLGRETRASFTSSRIEASFNRGWMTNETVSCEDR